MLELEDDHFYMHGLRHLIGGSFSGEKSVEFAACS